MKLFLICFFLILNAPLSVARMDTSFEEEKAVVALSIFTEICFTKKNKNERINYLNKNSDFVRLDDETSQIFYKLVEANESPTWGISFPNGTKYALVIEDNNNCYLISNAVNEDKVHAEMKGYLLEHVRKKLPSHNVVYNDFSKNDLSKANQRNTGFDVFDANGKKTFFVEAITKKDPINEDKVSAFLMLKE
jgi:hypothetical protein